MQIIKNDEISYFIAELILICGRCKPLLNSQILLPTSSNSSGNFSSQNTGQEIRLPLGSDAL